MRADEEPVLAAWRRFVEGLPPDGPLTDATLESWARCRSFGTDSEHTFPRRVPLAELEGRLATAAPLLSVAPPHMAWAAEALAGVSPFVVILTDADGVVLHSIGSDPEVTAAFGLTPGHDWSESRMGTNGIGTALAAGKPVAVVGAEHYSRAWHNNTCVGAPIRNADGRTLGAVDLSVSAADGDPARLVLVAFLADVLASEVSRADVGTPRTAFATEEVLSESARRPVRSDVSPEVLTSQLRRQAVDLSGMADHLLDAARLSAHRLEVSRAPADLVAIMRELAEQGSAARSTAASVTVSGEPALSGLWDRRRVAQALEHLLSLARRRGSRATELVVTRDAGFARIVVRDAALALSAEARQHVLAPLSLTESSTLEAPGVVLGLWIARQLVEAMGGSVEVETASESACFTVLLPRE